MIVRVKAPPRRPLLALALAGVFGCSEPDNEPPRGVDPGVLVPVGGKITHDGKPLATAVVTFLPRDGLPGVGETDEDGRYVLRSLRYRGVPPGEYTVAISYMVSADGEPQGLGDRNAMVHSKAMMSAREKLPREYSHLSYTTLRANVGGKGGNFDFNVKAPIPAGKDAEAPTEAAAKVGAAEHAREWGSAPPAGPDTWNERFGPLGLGWPDPRRSLRR